MVDTNTSAPTGQGSCLGLYCSIRLVAITHKSMQSPIATARRRGFWQSCVRQGSRQARQQARHKGPVAACRRGLGSSLRHCSNAAPPWRRPGSGTRAASSMR